MGGNPKSAEGTPVERNERRKWRPSNEGIWPYMKYDGKIQEQFYQGSSCAAPGKSGLHARGEGQRIMALESREGTRASRGSGIWQ